MGEKKKVDLGVTKGLLRSSGLGGTRAIGGCQGWRCDIPPDGASGLVQCLPLASLCPSGDTPGRGLGAASAGEDPSRACVAGALGFGSAS